MNVTEEMMKRYLETFAETYLSAANRYLRDDVRPLLLRYPLLQGKSIGYVSTQFGAGFEHLGGGSQEIEVIRSSARIEDLFFRAPGRVSELEQAFSIGGSDIIFADFSISGGFPLRLTTDHASIRLISIHCETLNWSRDIHFGELFAIRTADFWSTERAVRRATDEIFQAIVDLTQAERRSLKLQDYLGKFKVRTVLVLGDYDDSGRARLEAIRVELEKLGYDPLLLDQIPDDPHYSLPQKAVAVGAVCRFVVIDDSSKSGHLVEFVHVRQNEWVTVLLRLENSEGSFLTRGASVTSNVILEKTYTFDKLADVLQGSCDWAEEAVKRVKERHNSVYPWRR